MNHWELRPVSTLMALYALAFIVGGWRVLLTVIGVVFATSLLNSLYFIWRTRRRR